MKITVADIMKQGPCGDCIKELEPDCLTCEHFESYYDFYGDEDQYEPKDEGVCHVNESWHGWAGHTCELYHKKETT